MKVGAEDTLLHPHHAIKRGEPAWDIALLFPQQGEWTEDEYLALNTKRLVELSEGCLEVLPVATILHQLIMQFLFKMLDAFVAERKIRGTVLVAPLPVRLWAGKMREPDVMFIRPERIHNRRRPPEGVDLAMEVVSDDAESRERDLETKREEYAKAGVEEYWIVDPQEHQITVLKLEGSAYVDHGVFPTGTQATSVLLPGFGVDVASVFAAGEGPAEAS